MRLTVTQLRRIIKEEVARATGLSEARGLRPGAAWDYVRGMDAFSDAVNDLGAVQTIANHGKRGIKPGEVFARVELGRAFVEAVGAPSGFVLRYKPARGRMSQLEFTGDSYGEQEELWTITQETISGQA